MLKLSANGECHGSHLIAARALGICCFIDAGYSEVDVVLAAGLDSADLISQLRASHAHDAKSKLGVDVLTGGAGDMDKLGIFESFKVCMGHTASLQLSCMLSVILQYNSLKPAVATLAAMGIVLHGALLTRHYFLDDCFTWGRQHGATRTDFLLSLLPATRSSVSSSSIPSRRQSSDGQRRG